jgi:class 3 adenylate cyclase
VRCPSCMAENAATRRFCAQCGSPLPLPCPTCGFENEPAAKFCGGCGKPVGEAATPTPAGNSALPRNDGAERRQLTVMFCDLVGSTALSSRLDPEDLREVIAAYHRAVADVVAGFDGFVSRYMGDGVLVYFGYPQAHEDDAERAVRAGLGAIDAVGRLDVKSAKLQARVGIATGLVVVGDLIGEGSAQEQSAVGETPNLAARLQTLAEPDAVVIAAGWSAISSSTATLATWRSRASPGRCRLASAACERKRAAKPSAFVSLHSAARVRFSRSDDQPLSKLRLSSDRTQHSRGLRPQAFADPNRTSTPPMELVALGCGPGWHRRDWRDYWGRWNWGRCVPPY